MPSKSRAYDRMKVRVLRPPAEPLGRVARIGNEYRRITRPPGSLAPRDRPPADRLGRSNHFAYRMAVPRPEVQRRAFPTGVQMLKRAQMSFGQILDVNVVTYRRSVRCRVVGPIDVDVWPLFEGRLQHQRNEVGFGLVKFADLALRVGAGGVEIAQ